MPTNPVVILTREHCDNAVLRRLLAGKGVEVIEYPCIDTEPIPVEQWQWIGAHSPENCKVLVFTSRQEFRCSGTSRRVSALVDRRESRLPCIPA